MKNIASKLLLLALVCAVGLAQAQKLPKFNSSVEKKIGPKTIAIPYMDVVTYLDYAAKGNEDEVKEGKKFYYIYVWIPAVAPELGVRMVSPVGKMKVSKDAMMSEGYKANEGSDAYFDTYITLEKSNIRSKDKITAEEVAGANWTRLDYNDDTRELHQQPSGSFYNSLLRYKSDTSDPLKSLTVGLYRVGFTTFKRGEVEGTFLAEIGSPVKLPGVVMARSIEDLKKMME